MVNSVRTHAFVCALLAAFVAQSIVTVSHFHPVAGTSTSAIDVFDGTSRIVSQAGLDAGSKHKSDDASKCPICQAASVTGSFLAAAQVTFVPLLSTFFVSHDERVIAVERFMASWRSRAPPAL